MVVPLGVGAFIAGMKESRFALMVLCCLYPRYMKSLVWQPMALDDRMPDLLCKGLSHQCELRLYAGVWVRPTM